MLNFCAFVIVAIAVLWTNDAHRKGTDSEQADIDELLRSMHQVRIFTGVALAIAVVAFGLDVWDFRLTS